MDHSSAKPQLKNGRRVFHRRGAEYAEILTTNSPLCALNASVVNHLTPPLWAHVLRGEIVFHDLSVIRYVG
jgi:hypothetical protein